MNLNSSDNSTEVKLQKILVDKTSPTFAEIRKDKSQQATIAIMVAMMDSCQQYFNLQQPMKPQQLALTAELILEDYYYLRVDELQVCFRLAMKGEYGTLYNRIDGQVFFEWIKKFMAKRQAVTERIKSNRQDANNIYDIFTHPQMAEALQQVSDKLLIKEAPVREEKRSKPSNFEQLIMDEYDELGLYKDDMRFRVYNGTPYMFTEYRKARYEEILKEVNQY